MAQFKQDWIDHINLVHQEMNQLLNYFSGAKPPMVRFSPSLWEPAIDLFETEDNLFITVELPGVTQSEIELLVERDTFTIHGIRNKTVTSLKKGTYHRLEITRGPFKRSIKLPAIIDVDSTEASYTDGLVEVILPKAKTRRTHKLKIQDI